MNIGDLLGMGGAVGGMDDMAGQIGMAPQPPQMQQPQPMQRPKSGGGGLRNVLGMIGDALLVHSGHQPIYAPRMQQKRMGEALANYLGNLDPGLAEIIQQDPSTGLQIWKMKNPGAAQELEIVRELKAAGIDPASEEGRSILKEHLGGRGAADPSVIRVLQSVGIDPKSPEGLRLVYASQSPAGYLLTPPAGGAPGGSETVPTVNSPDEARKLPPGSRFKMPDGRIGTVPGGPTASPSGGFSVSGRNNPGALRKPGSMEFQRFGSQQEGIQAQEALLGRYMGRGLNNVSRIVETYAPRKSRGGDNTDAQVNNYIGYVARRIGVDPSAPLSTAHLSRLAQAMREFETGERVR